MLKISENKLNPWKYANWGKIIWELGMLSKRACYSPKQESFVLKLEPTKLMNSAPTITNSYVNTAKLKNFVAENVKIRAFTVKPPPSVQAI